MKKPKGKGNKKPKVKITKQKQKQHQSVNVKINIGQTKRASKGTTKMIPSYSPQPISSYQMFRDEPPLPPIIRNQAPAITEPLKQEIALKTPTRTLSRTKTQPNLFDYDNRDIFHGLSDSEFSGINILRTTPKPTPRYSEPRRSKSLPVELPFSLLSPAKKTELDEIPLPTGRKPRGPNIPREFLSEAEIKKRDDKNLKVKARRNLSKVAPEN